MVSTYNEPLITSEWAVEIFKHARAAGLMTGFVSNGNGTRRVLDFIRPHIDLYKVDLKSFDDRHYRSLGGRLEPILQTIRALHEMDVWLEIVTLLIPGFNNSRDEIERLTSFIAGVSPDIPWHVTAFHKDYRMNDPENTTPEMLMEAAAIAQANGLRYVYAGNIPGRVGDLENTRCHHCRAMLVERYGYFIQDYRLDRRRQLSGMRHTHSGTVGKSVRRTDRVDHRSFQDDGCGCSDGADRAASNAMSEKKTVAVIGASSNRNKFGNKALRAFERQGYTVIPINPNEAAVEGHKTFASVLDVPGTIDMATVYVHADAGVGVMEQLAKKGVGEVWLNPGADDDEVVDRARALGLNVIQACSIIGIGDSPSRYLVMARSNRTSRNASVACLTRVERDRRRHRTESLEELRRRLAEVRHHVRRDRGRIVAAFAQAAH